MKAIQQLLESEMTLIAFNAKVAREKTYALSVGLVGCVVLVITLFQI